MAGKSEEEEYLDNLLNSAMQKDAELSDVRDSDGEEDTEEAATLEELLKNMNNEDFEDSDEPETEEWEQSASEQMQFVSDLQDIVDQSSKDASIAEAIEALNNDVPTDVSGDTDVPDATDEVAITDEIYNPDVNPEPIPEDVPVLDDSDSIPYDAITDVNVPENVPENVTGAPVPPVNTEANDESQQSDAPKGKKKKGKKDKKAKKDKKDKKKKGLKSFFVEYEDENEPEAGETDISEMDAADINRQMMEELYQDTDSQAETAAEQEPAKEEEPKKEKKKKEKKQKPPKEKKPKQKKEKKPVDKSNQIKPDFGAIFKAVLIAAVLSVVLIVGTNLFNKYNSISTAQDEFDAGNYEEANDILSGMTLKGDSKDLYDKSRLLALVQRGITSYENYTAMNKNASAVDALIKAVGRKSSSENLIEEYGVASQMDAIYSKIIELLGDKGISEQDALDLYNMTSLKDYTAKLKQYGEFVNDSNN